VGLKVSDVGTDVKKTLEAVNELVRTLKEQKTNEAEAKAVPSAVTRKGGSAKPKAKTANLAKTSRDATKASASTTSRSTQKKENNQRKKAKGHNNTLLNKI
jgi:hypothetical protein